MFEFLALTSAASQDPALAIAASRSGALGAIDLQFHEDHDAALSQLVRLSELGHGPWGVQLEDETLLQTILSRRLEGLSVVILAGVSGDRLKLMVDAVRGAEIRAWAVATSLEEALAAQGAGADAVIAKGHEAAGWIGAEGCFVLLQRLLAALRVPVWAHGGIGVHTVAAAYAAGAAGAVLDGQLLLARESPLAPAERAAVGAMDGSETATPGAELGAPFRVYNRPGLTPVQQLRDRELKLIDASPARSAWRQTVAEAIGDGSLATGLLPLGQDAAFAADLARRFGTVAGIIGGLRAAIAEACEAVARVNPLAEGSPLARSHGTRYPIVQGPMTRVSDRAEFAAEVAQAGALPFLALALMRAPEVETLLAQTAELLGDRPWGVGILGFVPAELRTEQLEVVHRHRPPFALIAGGRPDQAQALEEQGITTYLHVPSPGLLELFVAQGARRFVFEGRECGGHVGPRSSFALWDRMLSILDQRPTGPGSDCEVLFAGGIHDARSASMVSAMVASATERGISAGVLLGTAYLFTHEATQAGAITETFQQAAVKSSGTVLLESGPGHATRCLQSPFVEHFETEKRRLRAEGVASKELRGELEQLNIGRLRIASKGLDRIATGSGAAGAETSKLAPVDDVYQWERGMYMIGEIAAMHDEVVSLADLHADISAGSGELLADIDAPQPARRARRAPAPAEVAVVGLGCILPGAPDVSTFWANILDKVDAIIEVPAERWDWRRMYDPDRTVPDKIYSRWGGFIDPVALDPLAFGLPPKSLESIEPFQLLALITAQAALRDAGYGSRPFDRERTSVILGAGGGGADLSVGYTVRSALPSLLDDDPLEAQVFERLPEWTEDSFAGILMNVAAGRIANRLDFGGTNFTVDAACASSLAAIAIATRELQSGTSDMVLAGGVDAIQNPFAFLCFSKTQALSPRGRCRPFDATADGIAISEGFATMALKRLSDAERDGDRIYSVIRGVGAASDGRDRSLTAPRPEGQMRALRRAYDQAGFSPSTVELVEAHGTGTVAGDGAEIQALSTVFAEAESPLHSTAVGSVKSMIGHTKATAGVAGMIKASLALHHRVLPPTIGVTEPNPKANFAESPFYVNTEARPWLTGDASHPRRAGVSAFGFGGTDFHIVLEEYAGAYVADDEATVDRWPAELLRWRGSRQEIATAVSALAERLAGGEEPALDELAFALAARADAAAADSSSLALAVESLADLRTKLQTVSGMLAGDADRIHRGDGIHWAVRPLAADGRVAFLFPGQGSQTVDMARDLTLAFPEARHPFELADRLVAEHYDRPLSRFVFPPPTFTSQERRDRQRELTDTHVAQAALGATELACLRVLEALGIQPEMTAGHSYGELAALAAAGGLDDSDLLLLSEARGRFMREAAEGEAGAMAAVDATPEDLEPILGDGSVVAANLNSPSQTVISGPLDRIKAAVDWCGEHEITARALPVACAFHSPHVAGARRRFAEVLTQTPMAPPRLPVYSNTTGAAHGGQPSEIVEVLAEHLAQPVQFVREIEAMHDDGARLFVEVGPRSVLTGLVGQILATREHVAVALDQPGRPGLVALTHCLATLAAEGVTPRSERLFRGRRPQRAAAERLAGGGPPAPSGIRWLVDGGSARPADQPVTPKTPVKPAHHLAPTMSSPPIEERTPVSESNGNGAGAALAPPPMSANRHPPTPGYQTAPAPHTTVGLAPAAPTPDRSADVMARYQVLMQQFLETQRDVMLGYLGARRSSPTALPSAALPPAALPPAPPLPAAGPPAMRSPAPAPAPVAAFAPPTLAAPAAAAAAGLTLTTAEIEAQLLVVVSERTGYPPEMLSLDGDLEGDLGIDSIKRVEIAGTFTQTLPAEQRAAFDMEQLTGSRTLREVIAVIEAGLGSSQSQSPPELPPPLTTTAGAAPSEARPFDEGPAETERIGRFVVQPVSAPQTTAPAGLAARGAVVILDEPTGVGVGTALAKILERRHRTALVLPGASQLQDPEDARALAVSLREEHGAVSALVHVAGAEPPDGGLRALLLLAQALQPDLEAAAGQGGAAILAVTRMGGAFGIDGAAPDGAAGHGAVAGFIKSLALEWPQVRAKVVDLPAQPSAAEAHQLMAELHSADGLVEVGYRAGERTQLAVTAAPLADRERCIAVDSESVIMLTGGARGITADVAQALAVAHRPTLVLVGRSSEAPEPAQTASLSELADLRSALIQSRRTSGSELTPALVDQDCRRILQGRELRANLERLRATGAGVDYRQCDVSDAAAFGALIDALYEQYGRIDGVIHGAGVIEDRLIADKRLDSLERVMQTKAGAARTLAAKLSPQTLRFLVMFSSVSGRFGNRGQADYAAASEVLNKLAQELDRHWAARVVSIDWGPWRSTGMVSAALEEEFARRGVTLIEIEQGCRTLMDELAQGRKGEVEVVVGAAAGLSMPPASSAATRLPLLTSAQIAPPARGAVEAVQHFHVARHRYLNDHRVDGRPVLPFAVAMELMAEIATVAAPGDTVTGLREIRLLNGVTIADEGHTGVRVVAAPRPEDGALQVTVLGLDSPRPHYRAVVELSAADSPPTATVPVPAALADLKPFGLEISEAYRELLFHGPLFQGVEAIAGMDARGSSARLRASSAGRCVQGADGMPWLLDPILLDSALQVQVMWARLEWDMTLLPAEIGGYRRLREVAEGELVSHEMRIRAESAAPMCHCDHWFVGSDGRLIATLTDVIGVGSKALNRLTAAAQA